MSQTDTALANALASALRAAKAEAGDVEEVELSELLGMSKGSITVDGVDKPYYRYRMLGGCGQLVVPLGLLEGVCSSVTRAAGQPVRRCCGRFERASVNYVDSS